MYVLKLLLQFQPAHPPWLLSPLTMKPAYKPNADLGLSAWQIILFPLPPVFSRNNRLFSDSITIKER